MARTSDLWYLLYIIFALSGRPRSLQIWWPFTQHQLVKHITVVDSAYQDHLVFEEPDFPNRGTQLFFDACGSWWTQGLGHGSARLALVCLAEVFRFGISVAHSYLLAALAHLGSNTAGGRACRWTLRPRHVSRKRSRACGQAGQPRT